ncbi:type IV pilin protein [Ectopseudomonas mendocina]|uniref:Pilus assembly protein PilE n=2 Tax=Ectopseudomonas mendocina TaxID=300 RepID=A0ABM5W009_ECTME|nr:type IV pilin protein [Pseudomonas mendocina]ALN20535.1 pilus assembly protein PilE [Pseudomonas mendocina S5.2]KER98549.1 pilus assembly protein PilE [Pseudomonas mendocina]QTN44342.1 type IV pilin protein [Pseudomonas mendocina]
MRYQRGFTLIELMIAVAIIGVLAAIAYPNYQQYQLKAGRSDGHAKLTQIMQAQERFYSQNQSYTANLGAGGLAFPGIAANAPIVSDEGRYSIAAQACAAGTPLTRCVRLVATAVGPQAADAQCGNLGLNSQGIKTETGTGTVESCW